MKKQYLVFSSFAEETLEELELKREQAEAILEMRAAKANDKTLDIIAQKAAILALNQAQNNLAALNRRISDIEMPPTTSTPPVVSSTTLTESIQKALALAEQLKVDPRTTLTEEDKIALEMVKLLKANPKSTLNEDVNRAFALAAELNIKPSTSIMDDVRRALALVTGDKGNPTTQTATNQPDTKSTPWIPITLGAGALAVVAILIFVD